MNETELIGELSRRAAVDGRSARAVVDALRDLVREGAVSDRLLDPVAAHHAIDGAAHHSDRPFFPTERITDPRAVDDLITHARHHRLGVDFLLDGHLGSVAAEFGAHAFTVEAARQRLREQQNGEQHGRDHL